jgi:hypothetical protein
MFLQGGPSTTIIVACKLPLSHCLESSMAPHSIPKLTFLYWSVEDGVMHSDEHAQISRRHQHTALEGHRRRRMQQHQANNISYNRRDSDSYSAPPHSAQNSLSESRSPSWEVTAPASMATSLVHSRKESAVASTSPQSLLSENIIPEAPIRRADNTSKGTDTSNTTRIGDTASVRSADSLELRDETRPIIR